MAIQENKRAVIVRLLGGAVLCLACPVVASNAPPIALSVGSRWTPSLVEDFNGVTLNSNVWTVSHQDGRPNGNNGVTWGWNANNVSVSNGKLVIKTTADGDGTFSSGHIWSQNKWAQQYGYFEARIKLPPANNGHQAAFWMTAQDDGHKVVGNDGRDGAEIDVVETNFASDKYSTGLHWDGYGDDHRSAGATQNAPGIHSGYHTFGMYWDADTLMYYYDGQLVRTYDDVGVPRVPEVLRASVGILDWDDGDIRAASLPQYTYFDSINAWRVQSGNSIAVIDSVSSKLSYTGGGWQQKSAAGDYGGSMKQNGTAGAAVTLDFFGSAVDAFVRTSTFGGLVDVYLDGQLVANDLDTYSPTAGFQHLLYSADGLTSAWHTIRLEATGLANPSAVSDLLMFDAFQIVPEPASLAALTLCGLLVQGRRWGER